MAYGVNVKEYLTGKHNWHTPRPYVEAARRVMGSIDLDPASDPVANTLVQAAKFYTAEEDGLSMPWSGNVWLNPPYGRRYGKKGPFNLPLWVNRSVEAFREDEIDQAILLVNAFPGAKWFVPLWDFPICFTDHRIAFIDGDTLLTQKDPRHFNAFAYLGLDLDRFTEEFDQFGYVVTRVSPLSRKLARLRLANIAAVRAEAANSPA